MSAFGGPNIITDGLVLNLDAGNIKSYPGSGTTWFDKSGNGNDGTLTNGPTFDSGNLGSIVFDGVDDYVNCSSGSSLNPTSSFTIISFYKLKGLPSVTGNPNIVDKWDWPAGERSFFMGTEEGKFSTRISYDGGFPNSLAVTSSISPTVNTIYFQCSVYDGRNLTLNINNVLTSGSFDTDRTIYDNQDTEIWLGRARDSGQGERWINADIYSIQVYNRALSQEEIAQNYNATKGRFGL